MTEPINPTSVIDAEIAEIQAKRDSEIQELQAIKKRAEKEFEQSEYARRKREEEDRIEAERQAKLANFIEAGIKPIADKFDELNDRAEKWRADVEKVKAEISRLNAEVVEVNATLRSMHEIALAAMEGTNLIGTFPTDQKLAEWIKKQGEGVVNGNLILTWDAIELKQGTPGSTVLYYLRQDVDARVANKERAKGSYVLDKQGAHEREQMLAREHWRKLNQQNQP